MMTLLKSPGTTIALTFWLLAALLWTYATPHAARTFAQAVPVPAASANPFWAGYLATSDGPYGGVQASWTVPAAPCTGNAGRNTTTYVWIGEGGYLRGLASPLIQAGTASDCLVGLARYHAFYEWFPGIDAMDFPIMVRSGDTVTVHLQESRPDLWTLEVRNESTGDHATTSVFFSADTGSAEFIVERPTLCSSDGCGQVALGKFRSISFHDIKLQTAAGAELSSVRQAIPIALVDPETGHELAVPARADNTDEAISVLWRRSS